MTEKETESDGEICGGPEPDRNSELDGLLQLSILEKALDAFGTEVSQS